MAFKFRKATLTYAAATATTTVGLGAAYGRVHAVEIKGDDADVDTNATVELIDADGRVILAAFASDAGDADATNDTGNQTVGGLTSTFGVMRYLTFDEAKSIQSTAAVITDNVGGAGSGIFAKSPITVNGAAGTSGDVIQVGLFVEV
jgi:hypothetical protein